MPLAPTECINRMMLFLYVTLPVAHQHGVVQLATHALQLPHAALHRRQLCARVRQLRPQVRRLP